MTWAKRLKRVFNIEIEACSECGGDVRIIASIEDPAVINQILAHLDRRVAACEVPKAGLRRRLDCSKKPTIQIVGRHNPSARYLSPWWQELGWNGDAARKHPVADGTSGGIPRRSG